MNKVAVVTGATSGIGRANVELLLKDNIDVIGLARSEKRAEELKISFSDLETSAKLHIVMGDLSSNQKSKDALKNIQYVLNKHYQGRLDILMNIAGIVSSGLHVNEDGNELTFATNHLSVFILTLGLVSYLEKSTNPRILVVSSLSHYRASINFNNLQNKKCYNILKAYKRSKLYNVFFVKAFARKYPHLPIFAIDPGLVKTEIGLKNTSKLAGKIWLWRVSKGTDAIYPASFMAKIAIDQDYVTQTGLYFKEGIPKKSNPITYNETYQERLWDITKELVKS
ncbi:MAG: SDR family NAD(P)-dependent oxidoreductase [Acholeplasma sp.]|jgi:NAD(P)-dependent dehydrogenase (short-subunit alcohol dehydrogenase family)|nr:MAG: SDR family NAD(P)-dependent oxidoreductase [Acholeplasma sp.]